MEIVDNKKLQNSESIPKTSTAQFANLVSYYVFEIMNRVTLVLYTMLRYPTPLL